MVVVPLTGPLMFGLGVMSAKTVSESESGSGLYFLARVLNMV